ncbi:MAG TPA: alpha-glucan family phosphorylase [Pseudomonadales bacterium]
MSTRFSLEVRPQIPAELQRMPEFANNLIYTWNRDLRGLFRRLDDALYDACGGNLKVFLRRLAQSDLDRAAKDGSFMAAYQRVASSYDAYHAHRMPADLCEHFDPERDLVAYFCFEFGFHESLPLYSGGLGILAADHCKAASDLALPLVAVGLLYHQGFFEQRIDARGRQVEHYTTNDVEDLPLALVVDGDGREVRVSVPIGDASVELRIWRGRAGHTTLYLLDSDVPQNQDMHRYITHRLYGGDESTRVMQEIVLGIGGVRALHALGIAPTVWHLNEGHAAFQIIERCHVKMAQGTPFAAAMEQVAAATVFTTHTPVAAGHDVFSWGLIQQHLGPYLRSVGSDFALDEIARNNAPERINMTALALRGSRHQNGVSRVHGQVAAVNERYAWPEIAPEENPITHVTNGVHLQTFLALQWVNQFDVRFGDWRDNLANPDYWSCIDTIPDHQFWSIRQELTAELFADVEKRMRRQHQSNGLASSTIDRATHLLNRPSEEVLVLGFARRFATYKRATLIFSERERLARLLNDPDRPVVLFMSGKAHPHDEPGKRLIEQVYELSMKPEFIGRVHLIENYDLALARKLVAGVDVWINTPEYPLEASGTSGMKAAINGAINLSVLDGWWAEGFDGDNGWGITPHDITWDSDYRYREEGRDLIDLLENQVIPLYFDSDAHRRWIAMAKASMRSIIPRFNAERMVRQYIEGIYCPAAHQQRRLATDGAAERLAQWKRRIIEQWPAVRIERIDVPPTHVDHAQTVRFELRAELAGLGHDDVRVECVVSQEGVTSRTFSAVEAPPHPPGQALFRIEFEPPFSGYQTYQIRMYPYHELLSHPFEMGRMRWI